MSNIEKIRQEIERRKGVCMTQIKANPGQTFPSIMEMTGYDKLLSFIDSLPEDDPLNDPKFCEGFDVGRKVQKIFDEQEEMSVDEAMARLDEKIAKASKSWEGVDVDKFLDEIRGREPDDLEVAADEYAISLTPCDQQEELNYFNSFIAGAKWMESQMPMPEDTVIFQKGVAEGRRLEREEIPRWKKGPADSAIRTRDYWTVSNAPVLGKPETRDYLIVKRGESMLLAFHAEDGDYYLSTEELDKIPTE